MGYGCNGWNPTSLTLNQWQHIAVVYNEPANQIIFYKNGVAYPYTIPGGCTHSSAVKYTLACSTQGSPGQFFAGSLDEVRVWNVARTQAQIVANMSVTIPSNSSGLVLNYQFNEGTGVNTANLVGAAYTGTLTNGPTWQVPSTAPITSPVVSTYTWSTGANTSSITINPTVTTSYSVAFTTTAGCIGTSPLATVNVNPLPVVSISGSSAICVGETATLVANGANTYTWSNASTASSITLSPASNTSYSLTGTAAGCIGLATTNLTVNANPIITVNSGAICAGQNFTINPNGANTYTIQGGNSVVSPAANTSYTVAGTSTEGCLSQAFATSSLTVNANPIITVNNGVICAGQNFTINPNGANTYTIQGGSAVVSPTSNASFTVAGTSASGCVSQAFATSNLTVNPNPTITVNNGTICAGQNFTINPNGANTYTIQG
ncbi:MAG: LamG domain-containing protein, partial [Verrucomicrobia bacterium]|nr:LamG domain-containing protein [Verrucomicrobiota bacterium]